MERFPRHPKVAARLGPDTFGDRLRHGARAGGRGSGGDGRNERNAGRRSARPERLSDQQEREDCPDRRPRTARADSRSSRSMCCPGRSTSRRRQLHAEGARREHLQRQHQRRERLRDRSAVQPVQHPGGRAHRRRRHRDPGLSPRRELPREQQAAAADALHPGNEAGRGPPRRRLDTAARRGQLLRLATFVSRLRPRPWRSPSERFDIHSTASRPGEPAIGTPKASRQNRSGSRAGAGGGARAPPPLPTPYCLAGPGCDTGAGPMGSPPGPPLEREPRNRRLEADRRRAPVADAVRERLLQARPLGVGERHRVVGRSSGFSGHCIALSISGSPATSRASPKCGNAAAHAAGSVVSVSAAPMKHSSVAPAGLSSSTFCASGTFRVSRLDRREPAVHREERLQRDRTAAGRCPTARSASHVQISWFAVPAVRGVEPGPHDVRVVVGVDVVEVAASRAGR